jgi:uncharacterized protein YkwD
MKSSLLSIVCACIAIIGTVEKAHADANITVSPNGPTRSSQVSNRQATVTPNSVMDSLELSVYKQVNQYRQSKNLPPLTIDPAISAQAKLHSDNMARTGNMSHEGFSERTESVAQTIVYRSAAENVAYNMGYAKPDAEAIQGWIESPGHHRNMLGRFDLTGIGVSKTPKGEYYFTQIFIRKAWYVKDAD